VGTILDKILETKKQEIVKLKEKKPAISKPYVKRSFLSILENTEEVAIIAEFKRASPSKGDINAGLDPVEQTCAYERFGADAISVLTDTPYFKGSFNDLAAVRKAVDVPILCKDFIIDPVQIDRAYESGANMILLIAAALSEKKLKDLYNYAIAKELEVLVEVHNEEELEKAFKTGTKLIGVNNRNLKTFEVDLAVTERLAPKVKESGAFLISESGLKSRADVGRVVRSGAAGILVGETFMTGDSLEHTFKQMKIPLSGVKQS
jgi:indole-3-glycerol phosphate synthase